MQTYNYMIGPWHACAHVKEVDNGKLMAVISVTGKQDAGRMHSRHTAVIDVGRDNDVLESIGRLVRRVLRMRHDA